jgi:hypothetical protein
MSGLARGIALALALLAAPAVPAMARETGPADRLETAGLCDRAAATAAAESGVPLDVLRAITRTETGRRLEGGFHPWPWTMNIEGKGFWFDDRAEAVAHAEKTLAGGTRSFDMGCFQVNYRWHGQHFPDLPAMMDPLESARYAARFLASLHAETGDWEKAAGFYHSRTPQFYTRYRERFARLRAALPPLAGEPLLAAPLLAAPLPVAPATEPAVPLSLASVTLPRTPGSVSLIFRSPEGGLLRSARPLFN